MTKAEVRNARKAAHAAGLPLTGDLALRQDKDSGPVEWSESHHGMLARERWARRYDALNGTPESDDDR